MTGVVGPRVRRCAAGVFGVPFCERNGEGGSGYRDDGVSESGPVLLRKLIIY